MTKYRSLETLEAVQYLGVPIPGVTCDGDSEDAVIRAKARETHGCDSSRGNHPHVHTQAVGGMSVLVPGMWIFPIRGGPWGVAADARFRGSWEVPKPAEALPPAPAPKSSTLPPLPKRIPAVLDRAPKTQDDLDAEAEFADSVTVGSNPASDTTTSE